MRRSFLWPPGSYRGSCRSLAKTLSTAEEFPSSPVTKNKAACKGAVGFLMLTSKILLLSKNLLDNSFKKSNICEGKRLENG